MHKSYCLKYKKHNFTDFAENVVNHDYYVNELVSDFIENVAFRLTKVHLSIKIFFDKIRFMLNKNADSLNTSPPTANWFFTVSVTDLWFYNIKLELFGKPLLVQVCERRTFMEVVIWSCILMLPYRPLRFSTIQKL